MRETHILNLLEARPFNSLTKEETETAELHISQCSQCRRAYDAARISSELILAKASEDIEVGPFFKTRVMAALRERHLSPEAPALVRMWRTAGMLASSMAALLMVLIALTIFTTGTDSQMQSAATAASQSIYSPEYVVLQQDDPEDDVLTNDDVVATMYELEDADGQ